LGLNSNSYLKVFEYKLKMPNNLAFFFKLFGIFMENAKIISYFEFSKKPNYLAFLVIFQLKLTKLFSI